MSLRALMPPFRFTGSGRMRLSVMCLSTARLWAATLVQARTWSPFRDTSMHQCKRFSIDQWDRTALAMVCASAARMLM